jgi:hypothetical protein
MQTAMQTIKNSRTIRHGYIALIVIACVGLFSLQGCGVDTTTHVRSYLGVPIAHEDIQAFLQERMKTLHIPGASLVVINEGTIVYHHNVGFADQERHIPITDSTIFEVASLSKSVFASFVMTFVQSGELSLDKPLHEYMPHPDLVHDPRHKLLTARMVLSHRTGYRIGAKTRKILSCVLPLNLTVSMDIRARHTNTWQWYYAILQRLMTQD